MEWKRIVLVGVGTLLAGGAWSWAATGQGLGEESRWWVVPFILAAWVVGCPQVRVGTTLQCSEPPRFDNPLRHIGWWWIGVSSNQRLTP